MKKRQFIKAMICTVILFLQGVIPATPYQKVFTSSDLTSLDDPVRDRFKRRVYDMQVKLWTSQGAVYVGSVPGANLKYLPAKDSLPGRRIRLHRDVIEVVKKILQDARKALLPAKTSGLKNAQHVTGIRIRSGYRSARVQFYIWERNYPKYYRRTREQRGNLSGGEHGEKAAQFLAEYINQRVFSPGYSPHQNGKTIDFTYEERGIWAEADTSPGSMRKWEESWLFFWLKQNARAYGFVCNPNINEPWHWETLKKPG